MDIDVDFNHAGSWGPEMRGRLAWLRENAPVFWSEKRNLWVATRYAHVCTISKNNEIFCSGLGVRPNNPFKLGLIDEDEPHRDPAQFEDPDSFKIEGNPNHVEFSDGGPVIQPSPLVRTCSEMKVRFTAESIR